MSRFTLNVPPILLNACHCYQFTYIVTQNKQTPITKNTLKHTHKRERVLKPLIIIYAYCRVQTYYKIHIAMRNRANVTRQTIATNFIFLKCSKLNEDFNAKEWELFSRCKQMGIQERWHTRK